MSQWPESLSALIEQGTPSILITIVEAKGSVPRGAGTKMIVTEEGLHYGTIGGGNLEYQCIEVAKQNLTMQSQNEARSTNAEVNNWSRKVQRFPLGASLGQCCGGMVIVLFEYIEAEQPRWLEGLLQYKSARTRVALITPLNDLEQPKLVRLYEVASQGSDYLVEVIEVNDFNIVVYGAGHVGRALVHVLSGLECEVTWVDSRADEFPKETPVNVTRIIESNPEDTVKTASSGSYFIVLTHSHSLDQLLCEQIIKRGDFRLCGLIGSQSKRKKFEHRLQAKGFSAQQIATLTCPIGIAGLHGKQPGHIAVAVAAQLLSLQENHVQSIQSAAPGEPFSISAKQPKG